LVNRETLIDVCCVAFMPSSPPGLFEITSRGGAAAQFRGQGP
jgi:hypothetical protein